MKKLFLILAVAAFTLGAANAIAQEPEAAPATEEVAAEAVDNAAAIEAETVVEGETMHHVLMQKFLEGGWEWMLPVSLLFGCRSGYRHRAYSLPHLLDREHQEVHRQRGGGSEQGRYRRC